MFHLYLVELLCIKDRCIPYRGCVGGGGEGGGEGLGDATAQLF